MLKLPLLMMLMSLEHPVVCRRLSIGFVDACGVMLLSLPLLMVSWRLNAQVVGAECCSGHVLMLPWLRMPQLSSIL